MPTPLPTQRPIGSTRAAPQAKSNNLNYALLILLVATIGAGGYGWVKLDGRLKVLETKAPSSARTAMTTPALNAAGAGYGNAGFGGAAGAAGPRGGARGGRGGGRNSAATIDSQFGLNLDANQTTLLDNLLQTRQQLRQAEQQSGSGDPNAADTSAVDGQIANMIGADNFLSIQAQLNGPAARGGRRGGNGAGAGGFGGAGG